MSKYILEKLRETSIDIDRICNTLEWELEHNKGTITYDFICESCGLDLWKYDTEYGSVYHRYCPKCGRRTHKRDEMTEHAKK